jgi:addiction module RelB/DinJ family antitoxin
MKTEAFSARIDLGRTARVKKILKRYGLTPAKAVNIFFAKIEDVDGLPFDLRPDTGSRHRPTPVDEFVNR